MKLLLIALAVIALAFFVFGIGISLLVWAGPPPLWVFAAFVIVVITAPIAGGVLGFWLLETGPKFNHHAP